MRSHKIDNDCLQHTTILLFWADCFVLSKEYNMRSALVLSIQTIYMYLCICSYPVLDSVDRLLHS